METKEIKINVPEGYEIDQENSTFECIKFKPVKKELPKTWEEFCETHLKKECERYISTDSFIMGTLYSTSRNPKTDRNLLPSKELAETMLALCQLIQLRDCYNGGWEPDWCDSEAGKYCINSFRDSIHTTNTYVEQKVLAFKTKELRDQFLENFRDLIETAKPLL